MTGIELDAVYGRVLRGATLSAGAGLTVILATPADGADELPRLIGGLDVPRRGTVRVLGRDPAGSPETRARLGLVLAEEPAFPAARTLTQVVGRVLALRGQKDDPHALLSRHGLAAAANAAPGAVEPAIRRHLAWVLALSTPELLCLVVHEPFCLGPLADREKTRAELSALAEKGVPVIAITASPREASALGGRLLLLDGGRVVRSPGTPLSTELAPGTSTTLRILVRDPRPLASALCADPAVSSVEWNEARDAREIRARGADADQLSLAVLAHAHATGAVIEEMELGLPAMEEARAATAGIWRAAYDNAVRAATARPQEPEPTLAVGMAQPTEPTPAVEPADAAAATEPTAAAEPTAAKPEGGSSS
jgi:ABC-2 type transport system ATP-binding protein